MKDEIILEDNKKKRSWWGLKLVLIPLACLGFLIGILCETFVIGFDAGSEWLDAIS